MKRLSVFFLILALCVLSFIRVDRLRKARTLPAKLMLLPSKEMTRVISFGNELLLAQLIFYNSMFFAGSLDRPPAMIDQRELYHTLDAVTYLDPYNMDGYYFAQGVLSWNRSLIGPLDTILRRGMAHRTWDWYLPFFYGFNQFYFLKNSKEGAIYLKKAYLLNPENTYLPTLIARLHYQANETEVAIAFLEEIIRTTPGGALQEWMKGRLEAFRIVSFLEAALVRYQERYKSRPQSLEELVDGKILRAIPQDPYGGEFYLDEKGRIGTTSKFTDVHKKSKGSGQ
ncbi:MAG: hypothetical protein JSU72_04255 [Deltaproteobacteria bacterium]|nr:MAG: hypothetical protein JSU72_04255 [Deltaproteobacteria bacterium]